jgi:maltose/moltooligosaccharide transporter
VKWSFYIGALIFLSAVMWTVLRSREYDPETLASFEEKTVASSVAGDV